MAQKMAKGALISGWEILDPVSVRVLEDGGFSLFGDVRRGVIVSHGPAHAQEAKEPRKAGGVPAGDARRVREDVLGGVLVLRLGEQGDGARDEDGDVEDHVGARQLLHPLGRQRVDEPAEEGEGGHDADGRARGRGVGEVGAHGDGREQELGGSVLGRGDTGDLAEQVEPAVEPADGGDPVRGREA